MRVYIGSIDEKSPFVYTSVFGVFDETLIFNFFCIFDLKITAYINLVGSWHFIRCDIIIALRDCVYWLELCLRWGMWPVGIFYKLVRYMQDVFKRLAYTLTVYYYGSKSVTQPDASSKRHLWDKISCQTNRTLNNSNRYQF